MTPQPSDSPTATPSEKWVAVARIAVGMAQMIAAFVGAGFLILEGPSRRAIAVAAVALILTIMSRLIFGRTKR